MACRNLRIVLIVLCLLVSFAVSAQSNPNIICYPTGCCYDADTWEPVYCDA